MDLLTGYLEGFLNVFLLSGCLSVHWMKTQDVARLNSFSLLLPGVLCMVAVNRWDPYDGIVAFY